MLLSDVVKCCRKRKSDLFMSLIWKQIEMWYKLVINYQKLSSDAKSGDKLIIGALLRTNLPATSMK